MKWQTWDTMLDKIKDRENELRAIEEQWRDRKYEEQYELQTSHHQERMKMSEAIENEISRVLAVLFDPQNNSERRKLLDWLSPVDPSTNYNSARKKHGISTGDVSTIHSTICFVKSSDPTSSSGSRKDNAIFATWKEQPNSLLWLHGKGKGFTRIVSLFLR